MCISSVECNLISKLSCRHVVLVLTYSPKDFMDKLSSFSFIFHFAVSLSCSLAGAVNRESFNMRQNTQRSRGPQEMNYGIHSG